jgi:hypothetical protein
MKILGYSERGIINSLIFSIGDDNELMGKFIGLMNLPETFDLGEPINYTILLEQSFSEFGDADLVIIIHYKYYKDPKDEKPEDKKVLFIEGKVKTSNSNWIIKSQFNKYIDKEQYIKKEKYSGYSSNLFFQLHLKKLMFEKWSEIKENGHVEEPKFEELRKIGTNEIVLKAFELIDCKEAYFVGLIPTKQLDIDEFEGEIDFDMHFLSWETVEKFCEDNKLEYPNLEKVIEIFDYNDEQIYNRVKKVPIIK